MRLSNRLILVAIATVLFAALGFGVKGIFNNMETGLLHGCFENYKKNIKNQDRCVMFKTEISSMKAWGLNCGSGPIGIAWRDVVTRAKQEACWAD